MKKLLVLILALVILCSSAAADTDPVVGYWYMYIDGKQFPEYMANIGNYDSLVDLYYFSESGVISCLENAISDGSATPGFDNCGKWEKTLFSYTFSVFSFGDGTLSIEGDIMKMNFTNQKFSMVLRRLIPFNPYNDILY